MNNIATFIKSFSHAWDVFLLFLIPIGGGIPGGVILAQKKGLAWPIMMILYFFSDVVLACVFEPIMRLFIKASQKISFFERLGMAFKLALQKTTQNYGKSSGVFALIMIAFGVDPMTGRTVAMASGHGFISGWMIAIAGDMIYFSLLMVSTLWLNNILGDGTLTMFIILALMMIVPAAIKKIRERKSS